MQLLSGFCVVTSSFAVASDQSRRVELRLHAQRKRVPRGVFVAFSRFAAAADEGVALGREAGARIEVARIRFPIYGTAVKQKRARCGACDGRARNPKQAAQSVLDPGDGSYEKPGVRSKLAASQRPDWCVRGDEAPISFEQRAE